MINCPIRGTVFIMDYVLTVLIYVLIFSCVLRHVVRTISYISEIREKRQNWLVERFKR